MKIALVYDHVNKIGGAERVLLALHELYPEAPLYTLVADREKAAWAKDFTVHTSWVQNIPFAKSHHEFFPVLPALAFEQFDFSQFDIVISVTSAEAKGIITSPDTLHICYLLTPTRYLWSHYHEYFSNVFFKILAAPFVSWLRLWDYIASQRPDAYIAISETVKDRAQHYYNRKMDVIHPPVDTKKFEVRSSKFEKNIEKDYFLIVSRLVKYKHIEIAIEACNRLKRPLIIVGEGMERQRLEQLAGPTVKFVGRLTDEQLCGYYQNCRALLFPQDEDFGITALEALSCGKPVIGYKSGGILDTIEEGRTGEFFYPQTVEALVSQLEKFEDTRYSAQVCQKRAAQFDKEVFKKKFDRFVTHTWKQYIKERKQ